MNRDQDMQPKMPQIRNYASTGYVISNEEVLGSGRYLVLSCEHDDIGSFLMLTPISKEGEYDASQKWHPHFKVYNIPVVEPSVKNVLEKSGVVNLKWFIFYEQMVRKTHAADCLYTRIPAEGLGETIISHQKGYTHADRLSEDNPLRDMRYWDAPGGQNLQIIHTAEWMQAHLQHCEESLSCVENQESLPLLARIIELQRLRRQRRSEQGVLGKPLPHKSE
jgi:hypothetical protein